MNTSNEPFLSLHYSSPSMAETQGNTNELQANSELIELPVGRLSLVGTTNVDSFEAAAQAITKAIRPKAEVAVLTAETIKGFKSRNVRSVLETIAGFWGVKSIRSSVKSLLSDSGITPRREWSLLSPIERTLLLVDLSQSGEGIVIISPESFLAKAELEELGSELKERLMEDWSAVILSSFPELCRPFADHLVMLDNPTSEEVTKGETQQRVLKGAVKADDPVFVLELSGVSPNDLEEDLQTLDLPMWKSTETSGYSVSLFFEDCAAVQPWLKYAGERDILVMRMDDSAPNFQGKN